MTQDCPSIEQRVAATEQNLHGSIVERTEAPLTRMQVAFLLSCMVASAAVAWGAWHYLRVSRDIRLLNSPDSAIRQQAAAELAHLKSTRSLQPLLDAIKRDAPTDYSSAQAEAEAAGTLGAPALAPLLADLNQPILCSAAADGLAMVGTPAVDPLIADLSSSDVDLRWGAARALGGIGDKRAVAPLIADLADQEDNVRQQAAESLGKIKDPRAVQPLIAALKDPYDQVRRAAGYALGQISDPSAANFLLAALRNQDADTVALAIDFFLRRADPGSEDALIAALEKSEDELMAQALLNSGNQKLHDAAQDWASSHNFEINYLPGGKATTWGGRH